MRALSLHCHNIVDDNCQHCPAVKYVKKSNLPDFWYTLEINSTGLCTSSENRSDNRPIAHDVTAPVMMHLEDKLAIYV
jgi:hypothetical protein